MNLNATNIMDFIVCPARFYYRTIRKIETDLIETPELIFGKQMHQILEEYPKKWSSYAEAIKRYSHLFDGSQYDKFIAQLKSFDSNYKYFLSDDDFIEYNFKIDTDYPDVFITGRIDRITKDGMIIDWKTGNLKDDLSTNIQAIIYKMAFSKIFGFPPKSVLFCSLKNNKMVSYAGLEKTKAIENLLFLEIIPAIVETTNFIHSGLFNNACGFCMFKNVCYKELGLYEEENKKDTNKLFAD